MKKHVFIGAYDKTDMLLYIAKLLTLLGRKVILIDTTLLKKSRYIIPTMTQENQYITTYEDIDIAIGFDGFEAIKKYQRENDRTEMEYDIALIDIDRAIAYQRFGITHYDNQYFVTSFDTYHLKRGLAVLNYIKDNPTLTKVYFSKRMLAEEDQYLMYLAQNTRVSWNNKDIVPFPFDTDDMDAIFANQRSGRISMRGLSKGYIDSILFLTEQISGEGRGSVKKALKKLDG